MTSPVKRVMTAGHQERGSTGVGQEKGEIRINRWDRGEE